MKVSLDWQMVVVCAVLVAGGVVSLYLNQSEIGYSLIGVALGLFGRQPVQLEEQAK